jgi:hypothetical protein
VVVAVLRMLELAVLVEQVGEELAVMEAGPRLDKMEPLGLQTQVVVVVLLPAQEH